ncbi:SDR family NAD(P)-dependent oxidoreductase [Streptomyces sp. NPDC005780]|uniref:SDR family NAD(P)-dependent oxidoreductase n=1 Tax=Streptomyces sp. NPDC005780 TaxID=3364730 RepID=UPI0036985070
MFLTSDDAQWHGTFELNLHAAVRVTRAALPLPRSNPDGAAIVHVTSKAARLPDASIADYAASKAALLSVSKALAASLGPSGVRSNVVSPGPTRTALFDAPADSPTSSPPATACRASRPWTGSSAPSAACPPAASAPCRRWPGSAVDRSPLRTHGYGRSSPQRPRKPLRGLIH